MAIEIVMPRLGWTMEQGVLTEWLKRDGDTVEPGDLLFTVESDKALQEVETFETGILRIPPDSPPPGTMVAVGTVIGYIEAPGETVAFGESRNALPVPNAVEQAIISAERVSALEKTGANKHFSPKISPRARRAAGELGIEWAVLQGSGRTGRIREQDVRSAVQGHVAGASSLTVGTGVAITPVAQELGVDLVALAAQNPGKKLTRADIEGAARTIVEEEIAETQSASSVRQPLSRTRQVIAERMMASAHNTAPVTLTTRVNAAELVRLREQLRADAGSVEQPLPGFNDMFAKIAAHALREHPALNAQWHDNEIVLQDAVHIGVAVDTERGLLVPVVREVQAKSLRQVTMELHRLVERVREGKATANDLTGGTFTITNLGMYEVEGFTPLIHLPQTSILGIGAIKRTPIFEGDSDRVIAADVLTLSLTFDHRLNDGAPAARFLQRIKQLVERPYIWLIH